MLMLWLLYPLLPSWWRPLRPQVEEIKTEGCGRKCRYSMLKRIRNCRHAEGILPIVLNMEGVYDYAGFNPHLQLLKKLSWEIVDT